MNESQIFAGALGRAGVDRATYLAEACAGDARLRANVEALLRAHDGDPGFLEQPAVGSSDTTLDRLASGSPTDVWPERPERPGVVLAGRYTLREALGEGGMGTVWLAEQTAPVKRMVAVKLIKAGMDSRAVLARFEAERQALALMDHPNIAKVFDAGAAPDGRPFFVMEVVNGVPITRFADENRLTLRQRLELFVPVCQAIQHAHQKGVIHRDLKPSNILVALCDGAPVPKVIDFGVAKATGPQLTEQTLDTGFGTVIGTVEYMSPEQAGLNRLDVDTRSDVYSLGVLLYELLAGSPPFTRAETAGVLEMLRVIREREPSRPSAKLSTADGLSTLAANRRMEPAKLTKSVRGELDWVVMKALEKDRDRRYETANDLALDLQRYLADEPVAAGPPGARYRVRKFLQRNRGRVVAASLVLALTIGGLAANNWLIRLEQAKTKSERDTAIREKNRADEQAAVAEAITNFFEEDILFQSTAYQAPIGDRPPPEVSLQEAVNRAAVKVGERFRGKPYVEARVRGTIANVLLQYRDLDRAAEHAQTAVDLCRQVLGETDDEHSIHAIGILGWIRVRQQRHEESEKLFVETLGRSRRALGEDHQSTGVALGQLGECLSMLGKYEEARPLLLRSVEMALRDGECPSAQMARNNLARLYEEQGRFADAETLFRKALAENRRLQGDAAPNTLILLRNLADLYHQTGRADKAKPLLQEALDGERKAFGALRPSELAEIVKALCDVYASLGRSADGVKLSEQFRDEFEMRLGPDHLHTLMMLKNVGWAYMYAGKLPEAIALLRKVREGREKALGPDHPETLAALDHLIVACWRAKQYDQSVPLCEEVLRRYEAKYGRNHPLTLQAVFNLGVNYSDAGRAEEAIPLLEELYQNSGRDAKRRMYIDVLRGAYVKAGKTTEAARLIEEQLAATRNEYPPDSPQLGSALARFGSDLLELKQYAAAEAMLSECLALREKLAERKQAAPWQVANARALLGGALLGQQQYAAAEPLLVEGYKGLKQDEKAIPANSKFNIAAALGRLIELMDATDRKDEADNLRKELEAFRTPAKQPGS
jgi:tetratricopeptide (TPR) repeat protein